MPNPATMLQSTKQSTKQSAGESPASSAKGICWNLDDLYQGLKDPTIKADQQSVLRDAKAFDEAYRGRVGDLTPEALKEALARMEGLLSTSLRSLIYTHLVFAADTANPRHGASLQAAKEANTLVNEHLIFFELEFQQIPEDKARTLLENPELQPYRHFLEKQRKLTPHTLKEGEEKIMATKENTGSGAFQRLFDETVSALSCQITQPGGASRTVSLATALSEFYRPEREKREAAAKAITTVLQDNQRLLTYVFNNLVQNHADNDRLRNRSHPMLARNLSNEIEQPQVDALLEACDGGMPLVARYYRLKKRLLGLDTLYDYDRYAPISSDLPACGFAEGRQIVLDAYGSFSPRMAEIAAYFFEHNWIDAETRPGKQGGAFSASTLPQLHPYILLNYTDNLRDVMTLAHEMGHGIHQYLSRERGLLQMDTPLTTAETASVFGEMLTFHKLMSDQTEPSRQLALLAGKLEDIFATVFRQAAMTRFEQKLHAARRERGELDAAEIGALWMETNKPMFEDSVTLSEGYAHWWGYIGHFVHSPFYCYAYSFGELLVLALYRQYEEEGERFVPKYLDLLAAGGSEDPGTLVGRMGLNLSDADFWQMGVDLIAGMVDKAEQLAEKLAK